MSTEDPAQTKRLEELAAKTGEVKRVDRLFQEWAAAAKEAHEQPRNKVLARIAREALRRYREASKK